MTDLDTALSEMERWAMAATPGPWEYRRGRVYGHIATADGQYLFERGFGARVNADAEAIAACSPERILALVKVAGAAKAYRDADDEDTELAAKKIRRLFAALDELERVMTR
jgi:hypothetical protein